MPVAPKIPVTVLTGFLGAGKTTLLNRILSENHGQRIAVIENEFGEIGVDQALVINADEEVFEMNNGCICCTVRGDLIRILGSLLKRWHQFDRVLLETTGLANPGPVAQTFFVDDDVREHYALDGIVTLVDARHLPLHLDESEEAREQVAFADVIVLNKNDLVSESELLKLERRMRAMNGMARIKRAVMASVPMEQVLGIGGFDLTRALEYKPTFLDPEYPFEWAGVYDCVAGEHVLELHPGPDPQISIVLMRYQADSLMKAAEQVFPIFSTEPARRAVGQDLSCDLQHQELTLNRTAAMRFPVHIAEAGRYALFAQHLPEEFELRWIGAPMIDQHRFAPAHTHDEAVTSVALTVREPLRRDRFDAWLDRLLRLQGTDLFRMKGFLHFAESSHRVVIQGVHMLVDTQVDDRWGNSPPMTQLVLIGRKLDRDALDAELRACVA